MIQSREGTIILVACSAQKLATAAPARDLYVSAWHRKARAYAEATGCPWFIMSAKYNLIRPEEVVEPYEATLPGTRADHRLWAIVVRNAIGSRFGRLPARVVMLGGERYCEPLGALLRDDGVVVERPLLGLGIGQQMATLQRMADEVGRRPDQG